MELEIKENLIKVGTKARPGEKRKKKWIVVHETDNRAPDASAYNHAKYISSLAIKNQKYLSWHYTIDDKEIFRHIPDDEIAWHAGDGRKEGGGNMNGIGIEICVNQNSNFENALKRTSKLIAVLMKKYNISINGIKQHYFFNGKNCPALIRKHNIWEEFLKICQTEYDKLMQNK